MMTAYVAKLTIDATGGERLNSNLTFLPLDGSSENRLKLCCTATLEAYISAARWQ